MSPLMLGGVVILGAAGVGFTLLDLKEGFAVEGQHWVMLLVILLVGYVAGRLFPQLGQTVGLP
jgi:hypothetical protein